MSFITSPSVPIGKIDAQPVPAGQAHGPGVTTESSGNIKIQITSGTATSTVYRVRWRATWIS